MDIVLVAGLWLPQSVWLNVCSELERLGHRPIPVALPGVDDTNPAATLADQLDAVLAAVDAAARPVVVGHSAACTLAWMAADRRPDRIDSVVLIGGFPGSEGTAYAEFFSIVDGVMPFPGWVPFEGSDSEDLDDTARTRIAEEAVAVAEGVARGVVRFGDERRFDIPVIVVCPEFTPQQAKAWIEAGDVPELAKTKSVSFVDIASGHWPMVSRPVELAMLIDSATRKV